MSPAAIPTLAAVWRTQGALVSVPEDTAMGSETHAEDIPRLGLQRPVK